MAMAELHNSIVQLEQFVLGLPEKTAYPISLLAKVLIPYVFVQLALNLQIYATFGNPEAIKYYEEVLQLEPNESVHLFDRRLAL